MRAFLCICVVVLYAALAGCYWGPPPGGDRDYWSGDRAYDAVIMSPVMMTVGGAKIATRLVDQEYHHGQESTTRQPRSQEAVSAGHPFSTVQSRVGNDGVAKKKA